MIYRSTARSISDLKAHLVLTTKYRRKVITPAMLIRLGELVNHISQKWGCEVIEFNGESDHIHLLFRYYPQMQLSKFVNALKSYTSQQIRKEFLMEIRRFYWGKPVFWNSAYFIASCGGVTVEVLKQYVQNQDSATCGQDKLAIPTLVPRYRFANTHPIHSVNLAVDIGSGVRSSSPRHSSHRRPSGRRGAADGNSSSHYLARSQNITLRNSLLQKF